MRGLSRRVRRALLWTAAPVAALVALFTVGVLWPLPAAAPARTDRPLAFEGVTVVDVERGLLAPGRTVVVAGGRIEAVGEAGRVAVPPGASRVDARGAYLAPALWDMHAHVYAVSPLLDLPLYIAYGVTSVRDMQGCPEEGDPFIACAEDKRRWSREAETGARVGPRIVSTTSFMANGSRATGRRRGSSPPRAAGGASS